jgi:hypothetical protein
MDAENFEVGWWRRVAFRVIVHDPPPWLDDAVSDYVNARNDVNTSDDGIVSTVTAECRNN